MKRLFLLVAAMIIGKTSLTAGQDLVRKHKWQGDHAITYGLDDLDNNRILPGGFDYCHWGNWMDEHVYNVAGQIALDYSPLTRGPFANVSNQDSLDLFLIRGSGHDLNRTLFPGNTDWSRSGRLSFNVGWFKPSHYTLFRYLDFPARLTNIVSRTHATRHVNSSTEKLIILVHGWNPDRNPFNYMGIFSELSEAIATQVGGSDWQVVQYPWARDADTGPIIFAAMVNGSEAAHIGHRHGWHLGELLHTVSPNLKQVHFIAHSAGTWVTRAATRYLMAKRSDLRVEVTLLDPFVPGSLPGIESSLNLPLANQWPLETGAASQLVQLDNYYAAGSDPTLGTQNTFQWRVNDLNLRTDWSRNWPPAVFYQHHDGPLHFFADSVASATRQDAMPEGLAKFETELGGWYGWRRSMFMNEPVFTTNPVETVIVEGQQFKLSARASSRGALALDFVQPPLTSYRWEKMGDKTFWATGADLTFPNANLADTGLYRVRAMNNWGATTGPWTLAVVEPAAACGGVDDAQLVSESAPYNHARFLPGETFVKQWTVSNTGASMWRPDCGQQFRQIAGHDFGNPGLVLWNEGSTGIAPGQNIAWDATFTAPAEPGTYSTTWSMYNPELGAFGQPLTLNIVVENTSRCAGLDEAVAVGNSLAEPILVMRPGETNTQTLSVRNTGQTDWSTTCGHTWQVLEGSNLLAQAWPMTPSSVIIQTNSWFHEVKVTAPATPGLYPFRAQLRSNRNGLFGPEVVFYIQVLSEETTCPPDAYAGNHEPALAFNLGDDNGTRLSDIAGPGRLEQSDWYRVDIPWPVDQLTVTGTYTYTDRRIVWRLYDAQTNLITSSLSANQGTEVLSAPVLPGRYYLAGQLAPGGSAVCIPYDLSVQHSTTSLCPPHAYGYNIDSARAYDLELYAGFWMSDVAGYGQARLDNWFRIRAHPGYQNVFAYVEILTTNNISPTLDLINADGDVLISLTGGSQDVILDYAVPEPGDYYLRLRGRGTCVEFNLYWDDLYSHDVDLWLSGRYLQVPLATTGQVGRLAGSGAKESIRVQLAGNTGTTHRLLSDRLPIQHHIIQMGNQQWRDGAGWFAPGTVTNHSSGELLDARITGRPHPDLHLERRVYFSSNDTVITVADAYTWMGDSNSPPIWAMDSINPDIDLASHGTYNTRNWLDDAIVTNDSAIAHAERSGVLMMLASGSPSAVLDTVGMQNIDPVAVWTSPLDANRRVDDDSLTVVQSINTLSPDETRTLVSYWSFGSNATSLMTSIETRMREDDQDKDGIPDLWEYEFYQHATGADRHSDPYGNGHSNWEHFIAGTDPLNPLDRLQAKTEMNPDSLRFVFPAKANRTYFLWGRQTLLEGSWQPVPFRVGTNANPVTSIDVAEDTIITLELDPASPFSFLRLEVQK